MINESENQKNANIILDILESRGYGGFFVGGCVRDMVMSRRYNDIDIATSAKPEQTKEIFEKEGFRVIETGIKHGTVSVLSGGFCYEITTYRIDGSYSDSRHPDSVEFTDRITDDLSRRDFTVNAMAMSRRGEIVDPFGGRPDIEKKIIRCVGEPHKRFSEDALRILRAVRFGATLSFDIEKNTLEAMYRCLPLIKNVAGERVYSELSKTVLAGGAGSVIFNCGDLLYSLFSRDGIVKDPIIWSKGDLVSAFDSLKKDKVCRLAALICLFAKEGGVGNDMTDFFIERMKCDGYSKKYLKYYVLSAFSPLPESKCQMNGEMVKWGEYEVSCLLDICKMLCDLGVTDCKSGLCKSLELYCEIVNNGGCLSVSGLHIKGDDLIKAGFKKSPEIGKILSLLVDGVVEGSVENTPQALLEAAKRYL